MMLRQRLEAALTLLRDGRVSTIFISGNEAATEVTAMRTWLEEHGVSPSQIIEDPTGTRTIETMRHASQRYGVSRAIVCTQELFMSRTLFLAQQNGIDAVGFTAAGDLPHAPRFVIREMAKSALAFVETVGRTPPVVATSAIGVVAAR